MASRNTKATATPATRSSARAKVPTDRPHTARATRAASKTKDTTHVVDPVATPARKPLWNRDNALSTPIGTVKKPVPPKTKLKGLKVRKDTEDVELEAIKAFLRIRPQSSEEPTSTPYLSALSSTAVQMTDPSPSTCRLRPVSTHSTYTFSKVFLPETQQAEFFTHAALPLVRDLLEGQNGLLFAYGVTNSGKTYTIQGGSGKGEGGLLPRTLDVVFNSVDGLHSDAPFRPVRLAGVEYDGEALASARSSLAQLDASQKPFDLPVNADQSVLASVIAEQIDTEDRDETIIKVDRNYEYSIWLSYAEIYNEKVFDLLGVSSSEPSSPEAHIPHSTSTFGIPRSYSTIGGFTSCANLAALANAPSSTDLSNPLLVKRKALALKNDPDGGKYIAGLREVRVRNAEEAKAIVRMGQINRRVFGTLANRTSSRSHGIFTLKIMRVHKGCPNDLEAIQTARLSIVDLAGSERANNTHNTGERLKEAGNINKSLMVLGQCMEALRMNQKKLATNPTNIKLGLVPFRHSKLTELFQDFFVGNGKAVMIVNVNPFDTGFDENSHVMKFSALARDVSTTTHKRIPPSSIPRLAPNTNHRQVTISTGGRAGTRVTETHLEVLEEDEEIDEDDDSEPGNPLVDALFEHVEELRVRLFESEMRCALIESETRDEVMREMEDRMMRMERMFTKRLMNELEENQLKTDRKIDMLHQAGLIGSVARHPEKDLDDLEDELGIEESLVVESDNEVGDTPLGPVSNSVGDSLATSSSSSPSELDSPLAGKVRPRLGVRDVDSSGDIGLFDDATEDEAVSTEYSSADEDIAGKESRGMTTGSESPEDESDGSEWAPDGMDGSAKITNALITSPSEPATVKKVIRGSNMNMASPTSPLQHKTKARTGELRGPERRISFDNLFEEGLTDNHEDSTIIIPNKHARKAALMHAGQGAEYVPRPGGNDDIPKKKKRTLGRKAVVTEEEIDAVTHKVANLIGGQGKVV
ncbi:P-loop containing nucleoside triphosphate hydrolase protein [Gautieria morchelliformis]|nr:P-loop containing nucleoside triphosphate hydrolase protein [Gautieria morchelliformis]